MRSAHDSKTRLSSVASLVNVANSNAKQCFVPLCNKNGRTHKEVSFDRIPIRPDIIKKAWIYAIKGDPGLLFSVSNRLLCTLITHFLNHECTPYLGLV